MPVVTNVPKEVVVTVPPILAPSHVKSKERPAGNAEPMTVTVAPGRPDPGRVAMVAELWAADV
jgi:hypothetical protein